MKKIVINKKYIIKIWSFEYKNIIKGHNVSYVYYSIHFREENIERKIIKYKQIYIRLFSLSIIQFIIEIWELKKLL